MKLYKLYLVMILMAFFLYTLSGSEAHRHPSDDSLAPPSRTHILGTDDIGVDIFAQLCHGGGHSLFLGGMSALLSVSLGSLIGVAAGYFGGKTDRFLMALCDIGMSIPKIMLLILLGAFLGASYFSMIMVLALMSWTHPARVIRARILFIKNQNYIQYSRRIGATFLSIFINHFFPMIRELLILSFIKIMNRSIVMEASLAYLGLGNPTSKSWGMMLNRAMSFSGIYFTPYWKWWVLAPLIALIGLVLSLMLYGKEFEVTR